MSRHGALLAGADALSRYHSAASVGVVASRAGWLRVICCRGAGVRLCRALAAYFLLLLSCSLVPAFPGSKKLLGFQVLCAAHPEGSAERADLWTILTENRRGGLPWHLLQTHSSALGHLVYILRHGIVSSGFLHRSRLHMQFLYEWPLPMPGLPWKDMDALFSATTPSASAAPPTTTSASAAPRTPTCSSSDARSAPKASLSTLSR